MVSRQFQLCDARALRIYLVVQTRFGALLSLLDVFGPYGTYGEVLRYLNRY